MRQKRQKLEKALFKQYDIDMKNCRKKFKIKYIPTVQKCAILSFFNCIFSIMKCFLMTTKSQTNIKFQDYVFSGNNHLLFGEEGRSCRLK